jgi:hypothetical protein
MMTLDIKNMKIPSIVSENFEKKNWRKEQIKKRRYNDTWNLLSSNNIIDWVGEYIFDNILLKWFNKLIRFFFLCIGSPYPLMEYVFLLFYLLKKAYTNELFSNLSLKRFPLPTKIKNGYENRSWY